MKSVFRESTVHKCAGIVGDIFDIQRFSIHDGPGIRTTVFFKGCPLTCQWCHNPESRSSKPELAFYASKCIGCGRCFGVCPNGAIAVDGNRVDRLKCVVCGKCAEVCPTEALKIVGKKQSIDEILNVVLRDVPFYKTSDGGVTVSGGEPLHQFDFLLCLLTAFKANNLHTAVETCGLTTEKHIQDIAKYCDLFLMDIKLIDPEKHLKFCVADNKQILEIARFIASLEKEVIFRTPIIPGCNDSDQDIRELGEFVKSLTGNRPLELMPYHKIGSGKYEALGLEYPLPNVEPPENIDEIRQVLQGMGVNVVVE